MPSTEMETYVSVPQRESGNNENYHRRTSPSNCAIARYFVTVGVILLSVPLFIYVSTKTTTDSGSTIKIADTQRRERFNVLYDGIRNNIMYKLDNEKNHTVCTTDECYQSASALSNSMNLSVDPCDDFYNFVCGQWNSDNLSMSLLDSSLEDSQFSILTARISNVTIDILREPVKKTDPKSLNAVKDYFHHCKDLDQLEKDGLYPMYSVLEKYGGWPLLYKIWYSYRFDFIKSMSALQRIFSIPAIFDIRVNPKGGKNVIEFLQPSFLIPQNILLDPDKYDMVIFIYLLKIIDLAAEINASPDPKINHIKMVNPNISLDNAFDIIEFETKLARAAKNLQTEGDSVVTVLETSLRNLDAYFDDAAKKINGPYPYNRNPYLQNIFNPPSQVVGVSLSLSQLLKRLFTDAGVTLSDDKTVRVIDVGYMKAVLKLLKETPTQTIANYLHLRMAFAMAPDTTKNMTKIVLSKNTTEIDREKKCSSFAERNFGLAISFKYVQSGLMSMKTKMDIQKMYEKIMSSFHELVETTRDWMSFYKHDKLTRKVEALKSCIGFPEWIENTTAVDVPYTRSNFFYVQEEINMTQWFLKKHLMIAEWKGNQKYKKLVAPKNNDCEWAFQAIVNAFYDTHRNQILLPPGVLQFPLFDQNRPESLNFGALGTIIGHELTHSYYSTDIEDSLMKDAKFDKSKKCLVAQYNTVEPLELTDVRLSGEITFQENFADVGGLSAAYYSLIRHLNRTGIEERLPGFEKYNSEQLFYIGFAHNWCSSSGDDNLLKQLLGFVHSPPRQRVVGALRNSKEFARAWKCPLESNMNTPSPNKCDIF